MVSTWVGIVAFVLVATLLSASAFETGYVKLQGNQKAEQNAIDFEVGILGDIKLQGKLGLSLPVGVGNPTTVTQCPSGAQCYRYGDFANVTVFSPTTSNENCARVEWTSTYARRLEDCFTISEGTYMYGGGEVPWQYWPINEGKKGENPYVTGDSLAGEDYGGVVENYWLLSTGAAIHVDEDNPLFLSWDTVREKQLCFVSADKYPYKKRDELTLKYDVCVGDNLKTAHQTAMNKFFDKPTGLPDETMLIRPLWSTWAQYKADVNQEIVLEFAKRIVSEGFELTSHVEIDDNWETCYGQQEFDPVKFPDPAAMVQEIKDMGFRVTVWVHPFINFDCPLFQTGVQNGYFVKDGKGKSGITGWWTAGGGNAGIIDVTNEDAVAWYKARLDKLVNEIGIDSFKFDAGETNWLPYSSSLNVDEKLAPNAYTTKYVDALATYGGLVEARSARRNQRHPIFIRMLDKLSHWNYDAGLKSMIPTVLQFGIVGYPFCLPDMIGGNAYGDWPSKELYIRWMQVNIFMPAVQFSLLPWDDHLDAETIQICKDVLSWREQYKEVILEAANQAVTYGTPINRPIWWVDPTDKETYEIGQAYMLGDKILVAPIVDEGAISRDIYLPAGTWISGVDNASYTGKQWLRDYPAPLNVVPFFIKQ